MASTNSKEFAHVYRPALHMIGALIPGVAEIYFLTESDVKKDTSTTLTCICMAPRSAQVSVLDITYKPSAFPLSLATSNSVICDRGGNPQAKRAANALALHIAVRQHLSGES